MKTTYFSLPAVAGLMLMLLSGCTASSGNSIVSTLKSAASEGKVLYGHQDDLMYGHDWNVNEDGAQEFVRSDVKAVCGQYPAVLGLELGGIEMGDERSLDDVDFKLLASAAVKHHERGGIVAVSWHPRNIANGGSSWDACPGVVASILEGGEHHEQFLVWLDRVCDELELMRDSSGKLIPVIWRPWHEYTGSWFWWGWDHCSAQEYIALWKMTYDYMVDVRGLRNLVWAVSPDANTRFDSWAERYPGDEYVDIIGMDLYHFGWQERGQASSEYYIAHMRECLTELCAFASAHGDKPVAVTETGCEGLQAEKFWTGVLAPAIEGFPVGYVLTWRNSNHPSNRDTHFYGPFPGGPQTDDFLAWLASGKVVML
ncbi:MAG: glycoside hydrolase family 26 protein [Candidatus Cryptobacteroides sp.]